ncbi:MAG: hypothetical protein JNM97_19805, partial [Rhodoferax sp.]|nr:hypothetical protein [Rhodoferax sp.]
MHAPSTAPLAPHAGAQAAAAAWFDAGHFLAQLAARVQVPTTSEEGSADALDAYLVQQMEPALQA